MQVSFKYDEQEGFRTSVEEKNQISIKNSLSGNKKNFSPTELLLFGMGGCTSDDVLSTLKKMKQNIRDYSCEVKADRVEEVPKTLKNVVISYNFKGDLDPEKVRKAINLSLSKYCSVSIIVIRGGANVTYSFSINGEQFDVKASPKSPE